MTNDDVPIGRRVARWRVRRSMTQQMLADRLRRSKSWVDKVERGVRSLDRYSVIQELAHVLRVDPEVLLGQQPSTPAGPPDGVDDIRAALARYDTPQAPAQPPEELRREVGYAWLTYQHAHYRQLVRLLPGLLDAAQAARSPELLVQAYRITSSLLVKLGEADLAWLAADRAMTTAADNPILAATATISVGQALRAQDRNHLALTALLPAANRVLQPAIRSGDQEACVSFGDQTARKPLDHGGQGEGRGVGGVLLVQAALAAAGCGEHRRADELIDRAAGIAAQIRGYDDQHRTSFGPIAVEVARVLVAALRGDVAEAVRRHVTVVRREAWRRLPAEYRGAYLVDAARAYLQVGDLRGAARALVDADSVAPAEVRCRPLVRTVIADVARAQPAPAGVARLATLVGLTR
ncbi:helix-turn-helix domain-containing protein [Micromonospora parathelypteridis]|uniref:Transcriptional regulator with XRE-family HTH domain n=1 Tax=Micromonospora parathelypteridis TaxID=1839617 RepID=A0A840VVM3_9ACTN|nr:helix-turn-helix transcriptional regulator [Micromonospora parathelypteridis]MBB5481302.1 transcriptional regulator with XRE-family HTH domain [Micromonospora parathelypteridis]GGO19147.1 transcriptional regulator [Micromonospora parathelypteridis]